MLGAGAFGTVWMATARESGAGVAIKIVERKRQIHEDFSLEPAEVEILKCIHHPNIVELIDLVTTEASVYLIMELVMGGHLQDRLKAHGPYREVHARSLIGQVVGAVRHLHDQNIIHRDIKPENILFAEPEEAASDDGTPRTEVVKLTDFGLSTMKEGRLTTRCGTPSYCAPELLSGEGYGKAVDIWSLGVLTYVVLTGVQPFVGTDRQDLFRRIQKGQYTYPGERTDHGGAGARRGSCGPAAAGAGGSSSLSSSRSGSHDAPRVSELAKDLISRMLKLEPMERYSTRETLQHPWLSDWQAGEQGAPSEEVSTDTLVTVHELMRGFIAVRRLKRAGLVVLACGRFRLAAAGWPWPSDDDFEGDDPSGDVDQLVEDRVDVSPVPPAGAMAAADAAADGPPNS